MDFIQDLIQNSNIPVLTAFLLGLATAISPCPLATNITAIAYISKDIENQRRVFYSGLVYTLGRAITYTAIGLLFFFGASQFKIAGFLNKYGERIIGPALIIIGLFMLDIIKIKLGNTGKLSERIGEKAKSGNFLSVLFMGMAFALAFCPYSGVLYFGMLIPITISSAKGLYLPIIYAFGTGLPVIIFAYFIAFTVGGIGNIYNKVKTFELWFRRVVAFIFIGVGIYYLSIFLF
ncbi:aromatic aminobenezylarsenical efflux permease ArsG family transporter [Tenuifilum thalassicum]|uniref:Sulfite exporter TauE/SafE family protein n=1 Tax=Tenuifilum thalassicum TaxID=2590900 RepID=A0A7D3XK49_9BACT|nr:aromatic aminobenezylarsenical efflux permease ArsG family transporter [Tenuifilum thalassicum]QKG79155.1 sulfite exporter TauE/SafE family protein [Tenuifilum thalassicum]